MTRLTNQDLQIRLQNKGLGALLDTSGPFRKFVFTLFTEAGLYVPTYQRGSSHGTAYLEGRRSLGLEVLHMLKHVRPDILSVIEREGNLLAIEAAPPPGDDNGPQDPSDFE